MEEFRYNSYLGDGKFTVPMTEQEERAAEDAAMFAPIRQMFDRRDSRRMDERIHRGGPLQSGPRRNWWQL